MRQATSNLGIGNSALSATDRELVYQLTDDINIIVTLLQSRVKPGEIRVTLSPMLRRWIIDGHFFYLQKLIQPSKIGFKIRTNPQLKRLSKAGVYKNWMSAISFNGSLEIATNNLENKYIGTNGKPDSSIDFGNWQTQDQHSANNFFKQSMFFWKGEFFGRDDVIKMLANSLGGAHFDKQDKRLSAISEIQAYFGLEIKPHTQQILVGGEIAEARADPARRHNVYDGVDLVVLDTARIFSEGVSRAMGLFDKLLN